MLVEAERGRDRTRGLALKNPGRCRADREDACSFIDRPRSVFSDGIPLRMHAMVCDAFDLDRQKGASSYMKCNLRMRNAGEKLRSKMQARSRGGHGTGGFGEHGLVSDLILLVGVATEIGRDRHTPKTFEVWLGVEF